MGCKGSKDAKEDKKIDSSFDEIKIQKFDEFFRTAGKVLESAETVRSGLDENREKGAEISHTYLLKDPKYVDMIQVLFWTLSAEAEGHINKTGIDVTTEAPFIKLEGKNVTVQTYSLYETFASYVKTVVDGPATVKDAIDNLQLSVNEAPELAKEAKGEIEKSDLNFAGKAQAIARFGKNSAKLTKELAKCQKLSDSLKQAGTDLKELAPQLKDLLKNADEIGAKAHAEGLTKPGEVFDKFHTGARKEVQKKAEEKKHEEKKTGEKKPEEKKPEEKKTAEKKPEEKKPAEKKPEEKKPAEKKPEEKKPEAH